MNGYHDIYLQMTVTIPSTYNGRLPWHLLTIDSYHINFTYNGWLPQHILIMNGTIASTYNGWLPQHLLTMGGYHNIYLQ